MPASLRLLLGMIVAAIVIAIGAVIILEWQDRAQGRAIAEQLTGGSVSAGKTAFQIVGCGSCHAVETVAGADGQVGPPLDKIAIRTEIAGHLANTPEHLKRWIQHPQQVSPGNGMPDMRLTDQQTRDIAAYLYTMR